MDFNTYLLIIPLSYTLMKNHKNYQTVSGGILNDRYVMVDGKIFFKPYYTIPLNNNYDVDIVFNKDGSVSHLSYEGDLEYCQEIIDYYNIENPELKLIN